MKNRFRILLSLSFALLIVQALAQAPKKTKSRIPEIVSKTDADTKKKAAGAYKSEMYQKALGYYLSLQKGAPDNATVSLLRIDESPQTQSKV